MKYADQIIAGEVTVEKALVGLLLIGGGILAGGLVRLLLKRLSENEKVARRQLMQTVLRVLSRPMLLAGFTLGLRLAYPVLAFGRFEGAATDVMRVLVVVLIAAFLCSACELADCWLMHFTSRRKSKLDEMMVPMVRKSLRFAVVLLAVIQIFQMLSEKPITSILAGLGVGGLAVALAAQETIKNFFGSLVIFADKPFEMGERVIVNGVDGIVEEVGFRSTRLRTLAGALVTYPNGELANMAIENMGKRPYIRRIFTVSITYDTPPEKVDRAVEIISDILKDHEGMNPDFPPRVYFNEFASSSLDIFVAYWYHPAVYWDYMEFSQKVNKEILRRFNEAGIDFAFPTQTVYLAGDPDRPLNIPH